jgi:hypothetical protein
MTVSPFQTSEKSQQETISCRGNRHSFQLFSGHSLIADDLNTALSGFGHKQCKTPNLDRLAERGVKFENMHCQYPVCGVSHASIMSGLYPFQT